MVVVTFRHTARTTLCYFPLVPPALLTASLISNTYALLLEPFSYRYLIPKFHLAHAYGTGVSSNLGQFDLRLRAKETLLPFLQESH